MNAANSEQTAQKIRTIFHIAAALHLSNNIWPKPPGNLDEAVYDYIIVGAGTAGCVLANRLIEMPNVTVLLIEAGDKPPLEATYPRYFPYLKQSSVDWNLTSAREWAMRYHKNGYAEIPQGKMLGGTSNLNYMIYGHGNPVDYATWATAANDTSWLFEEILPLFNKHEHLIDSQILASPKDEILYGKKGKIKLRRYYYDSGLPYLNAFEQMGHKILLNINARNPLGFSYGLFSCGKKSRQDTASAFLKPIKYHPRLHVLTNSLVTKIIFNSDNTAVGVNVLVEGNTITIIARKEIILSAGVFKTPQLLLLSGIGPRQHLKEKKIKLRVDLPVGKTLHVSPVVITIFKMGDPNPVLNNTSPTKIEFPLLNGHVALHNHDFPDYVVQSLILENPTVFLELCVVTFSYVYDICNKLYKKIGGKQIYVALNYLAYPKSTGEVLLNTLDMKDQPSIRLGLYTHQDDRMNHAAFLLDFHAIVNTTFFRKVNSKFMDPQLGHCGENMNSLKYWSCYALTLVSNAHNYASTCAIGKVVDSNLLVKGVKRLRVADASVIPNSISSPLAATVMMIAEKAAIMIKENKKEKEPELE